MWTLESNVSETVWVGDSHFFVALRPDSGSRRPLKRFRDHTHWAHHTSQDSCGRAISLTRRHLPDNTEHSQEIKIHAPGGIRTRNPSKWAAADPHLRPAVTGIGDSRILIHNFCIRSVTACEWILLSKVINLIVNISTLIRALTFTLQFVIIFKKHLCTFG
jgi:hypothetical protein